MRAGDFEDASAWSALGAEITTGSGVGGSKGGRLKRTLDASSPSNPYCRFSSLASIASVPSAMVGPALELSERGTAGDRLEVLYGGVLVGRIAPDAALTQRRVCLPGWSKGGAASVVFQVEGGPAALCANEVIVDDVKLVSDPSCEGKLIDDGGFEAATNNWNHGVTVDEPGSVPEGTVTFDVTPGAAHSGNRAAKLTLTKNCAVAHIWQVVTIPAEGARVSYWYRTSSLGTIHTPSSFAGQPLTESLVWTQKSRCISGSPSGPAQITGTIYRQGLCTDPSSESFVYFDDIEVVADPSCK